MVLSEGLYRPPLKSIGERRGRWEEKWPGSPGGEGSSKTHPWDEPMLFEDVFTYVWKINFSKVSFFGVEVRRTLQNL